MICHRRRNPKRREPPIASNILFSLPGHLLVSIVNRVGRVGFQELGPLLASGRLGRDLVYSEEVLKEACLQPLLDDASLVHTWSIYRLFFTRCVEAGNAVARYLESLRLTVFEGKIGEAISLLLSTSQLSEEMEFALGLFLIVHGQKQLGRERLDSFKRRVGSFERAEYVSEVVFQHLREIVPVAVDVKPYATSWKFDGVPRCALNPCTVFNRCPECFNYWRVIHFIAMY